MTINLSITQPLRDMLYTSVYFFTSYADCKDQTINEWITYLSKKKISSEDIKVFDAINNDIVQKEL